MTRLTLLALISLAARALEAQSAEEQAVRATVQRFAAALQTADSILLRSILATDARLVVPDTAGNVRYRRFDDAVMAAVARSAGKWHEVMYDLDVRIDGRTAQVWGGYTFYDDGRLQNCGVNAFQLTLVGSAWKITQISDTKRTVGCPDPRATHR